MNKIAPILSRIGNTPIIRIFSADASEDLKRRNIFAKIESVNPGYSVKDRIAYAMIQQAISSKLITDETVVIEPTSGNTGIGLALVCAALKLKLKLTMPETMSIERRRMLKHLGAEIILTEGAKGMKGAIEMASNIKAENASHFMPQQFENPANPEIHRRTTAVEFLNFMFQTGIKPDALVFGVGTGGTLTGVSEVVSRYFPETLICAVEPESSPVLSGGQPGPHKIQGIGAGFIPKILNTAIIKRIVKVSSEQAFESCKKLSSVEGILAGISSGAAAFAAKEVALSLPPGSNVFTLFPDTAERYLSMLE
ncbi:MAG TPA: cysteine synthase A [Candidatus Wallbacteria bacterium]|nr:cysteine synthase A [Candidatus Wallbacteria bacterium]